MQHECVQVQVAPFISATHESAMNKTNANRFVSHTLEAGKVFADGVVYINKACTV